MPAVFYGALDAADTYFADRGNTAWAAAGEEDRAAALVRGSQVIDGLYEPRFPGLRTAGYDQVLSWPRKEAVTANGEAIPQDVVPAPITYAAYEAAAAELAEPGGLTPIVTASQTVKRGKGRATGDGICRGRFASRHCCYGKAGNDHSRRSALSLLASGSAGHLGGVMVAFDYAKTRATAERLIAKFGQQAMLRRITNSGPDYDPVQTSEDFRCMLLDLDCTQVHIGDTLIQRGDRMIYLSTAGLSIAPMLADKLLIAGVEHAIVDVQPLSPGGVAVLWQLQVRQ